MPNGNCWDCGGEIALKDMPVHNKCENIRRREANKIGYYGGFQWEMLPE